MLKVFIGHGIIKSKKMTKKMLVPIDLENPEKDIRDFLYPSLVEEKFVLRGIKSGKIWENGIVSFTGKTVTSEEIFAKIVDSGQKISSVSLLMKILNSYVGQLKEIKLGTVVKLVHKDNDFILETLGRKPRIKSFGK